MKYWRLRQNNIHKGKFTMLQYAWLELDRGMWRLFTDKSKEPVRKWVNRDVSLDDRRPDRWKATPAPPTA
jgi:hypothetical protein